MENIVVKVGVKVQDTIEIHIAGITLPGDYDTLCGMDVTDLKIGHNGYAPITQDEPINCVNCARIFHYVRALDLSDSDFN